MENTKTKTFASIRKNKVYGAVGVIAAMGVMSVATQSVSADQVTGTTTPEPTPPPTSTTASSTSLASMAQDTTSVAPTQPVTEVSTTNVAVVTNASTPSTTVVQDPSLTKAVADATAAGVHVNQNPTVNIGTASTQAEADALKAKATTMEQNQVVDVIGAIAEQKSNSGATTAQFDSANASTNATLPNSGNGYTPSGSTTHLPSSVVGNFELVGTGDLKNPTVYVKSADGSVIDQSKIVKSIIWGNVAPQGADLTNGLKPVWDTAYNYNVNGTTTQLWMGKILTWYKIPGAITMLDGSVHDAYVQFHSDSSGLDSDGTDVAFWNQDGAINALDGWKYAINGGVNALSDGLRTTIAVDDPSNKTNYLWITTMYDIDGGQFVDALTGSAKILGVGGGMSTASTDPSKIASDENLGYTYGINSSFNGLNGRDSSPDGAILFAQYGGNYSTVIRNTPGGNGSAVARADFGAGAKVDIQVVKTNASVSYNLVAFNTIGSVLVDNYIKETTTKLTPTAIIKDGVPTGESYTATHDQKIVTTDGKTYVYDSSTPNTSGTVTIGTIQVDNFYVEVKGDVTVDYQTTTGVTLKPTVVDTPPTSTGTSYDTRDHKPTTIVTTDGKTYTIVPTKTIGNETGKVVEGTTNIVYIYDEAKGDVTVDYQTTTGVTLKPTVVDTPPTSTGTSYDTRDHKPTTIVTTDGKTYTIVPTKTIGNETGKVVVGNTNIVYIYDEVKGDVIVHYLDDKGNTIHADVVDTPSTSTGTPYDTTDVHYPSIFANGHTYVAVPSATKGNETGKVVVGTTEVTYIYKIENPLDTKSAKNDAGQNVDGKVMLQGSNEHYTISIDNDQYKGIVGLTELEKSKPTFILENIDENVFEPNLDTIYFTTKGTNNVVKIATTSTYYKDIADVPQNIKDQLKVSNITIKSGDGFVLTLVTDNASYLSNYALKGISLDYHLSGTIKQDTKATNYQNIAYVSDFNGVASTNIVKNSTPEINPEKDVVITVSDGLNDTNSIDGKTVKVGDTYNFELEGSLIPGNRGTALESYQIVDTWSDLISYDGVNKWFAKVDITLKDGSKIVKGTDISKYIDQVIDQATRTVSYTANKAFLSSISNDSEFQIVGYMQVHQDKDGVVENTFKEIINGKEYYSNKVTVQTEKPVTPNTPSNPPKVGPKVPEKTLPYTGENNSGSAIASLLGMALLGLTGVGLVKKRDNF